MANEPLRGSKGLTLQALQKRKGYKFFSASSFIWVLEVRPPLERHLRVLRNNFV